jgi:hypothetical protein
MDSDQLGKHVSELAEVEGATEMQGADDQGTTAITSLRKTEANRRNGTKGGPKTEAGKRRSRRSALKHGMRATTLLLDDDGSPESDKFREVRKALEDEFQPRTTTERMLVEKMVLAILRTRSGCAHERQELSMDSAFQFPAIDRLIRYGNAADKLFFVALAQLQKLQAEDIREEVDEESQ